MDTLAFSFILCYLNCLLDLGNGLLIILVNDAGDGVLRFASIDGIRLPQVCIAESARYDHFG